MNKQRPVETTITPEHSRALGRLVALTKASRALLAFVRDKYGLLPSQAFECPHMNKLDELLKFEPHYGKQS